MKAFFFRHSFTLEPLPESFLLGWRLEVPHGIGGELGEDEYGRMGREATLFSPP